MQYYIARRKNVYGSKIELYSLGYEPQAYASRAEAIRAIDAEEQAIYHASQNEYGHPNRKVVSRSELTELMRLEVGFGLEKPI
jgi:beta-lactamase superfamily II metal-dependent hydrolase